MTLNCFLIFLGVQTGSIPVRDTKSFSKPSITMRFIPVILMALALGLSPIAAFTNNWMVVAVVMNVLALVAALFITFEVDVYRQPEGKVAASILWGLFVVQLAWAIMA